MRSEDIMYNALDSNPDSHMSNDTDFDSEYVDAESDSTSSNSRESLFSKLVRENNTNTKSSVESLKSGYTSDMSTDNDISELDHFIENMTDDNEFHIIQSPLTGQPNILLTKVTLLHTKSEDKKPRVKTFIISHNLEPLLNLLRHLLSMTIDDEIFAPEFKKLEDIY
ncbi:hypothetical protein EMCG_08406 [[Emmonsia] crescens]|uniref:Uncharacterized protein n=1 Tax=[Emmonsia] crescens TaxID=73230 RepID=A0A0G2JAI4_9EURO|nr:hypothetical protein EMCG_08406 [Emmonsia crescens UAMH 3008]